MATEDKKCPLEGQNIDYKNTELLSNYLTKFGKIVPRYYSGVCLKNQKKLSQAIKRARTMGLLPYVKSFDPNYESTTPAPAEVEA